VQGDLVRQLELTRATWAKLQELGVTDETELSLDFFYIAPGQHQAEALAQAIRSRTDYDVRADSVKEGLLGRKTWKVNGTTQPTPVSQEALDEWVTRMVEWGNAHSCEFDGWGAGIPNA
jgi:Regulator of ribonuclease activity B